MLKIFISIKREARDTCFHRSANHIFLTFPLFFLPFTELLLLTVWVGDGEMEEDKGESE